MQKFLALYLTPVSVLEEWMKTGPEVMKAEELKMRTAWNEWMEKNGSHIVETKGAGKTKRVTKAGVEDVKNAVMLYSIVEAESHEEASKIFESHPHLTIPEATIEILVVNPLRQ